MPHASGGQGCRHRRYRVPFGEYRIPQSTRRQKLRVRTRKAHSRSDLFGIGLCMHSPRSASSTQSPSHLPRQCAQCAVFATRPPARSRTLTSARPLVDSTAPGGSLPRPVIHRARAVVVHGHDLFPINTATVSGQRPLYAIKGSAVVRPGGISSRSWQCRLSHLPGWQRDERDGACVNPVHVTANP
jgi:hypothetical protein